MTQSSIVRACAVGFVWLLAGSSGVCARDPIQLRLSTAKDCPDRAYLRAAIDELVPEGEQIDPSAEVAVEIRERDDGEFSLRTEWTSSTAEGSRLLDAESCQAATDTAAWLIALALKQPVAAKDRSASGLRYELGVGALADFAVLPGLGWAATARAGLATGGFHFDVSAAYFPPTNVRVNAIRAEVDLLEFGLRGCYLVASANLALGPCVRAALGRMAAASVSVPPPTTGSARYQALSAALEARVRLAEQLWLVSDAALIWNQRRPLFMLSGGVVLYQPDSVGLRLSLGLILRLR